MVSDSDTDRYRISYRPDSLLLSIVTAVAAVTGRDPISLPPLGESIDTDALETLFGADATTDDAAQLEFVYSGCRVSVRGDETLLLMPQKSSERDGRWQ